MVDSATTKSCPHPESEKRVESSSASDQNEPHSFNLKSGPMMPAPSDATDLISLKPVVDPGKNEMIRRCLRSPMQPASAAPHRHVCSPMSVAPIPSRTVVSIGSSKARWQYSSHVREVPGALQRCDRELVLIASQASASISPSPAVLPVANGRGRYAVALPEPRACEHAIVVSESRQ